MSLRRTAVPLSLSLLLLACGPAGPEGLKAVNVGTPAGRGLGSLSVDPGGRPFVEMGGRVFELTGSLEQDTQVWVEQPDFAGFGLTWAVPGFGATAQDRAVFRSLTDATAEAIPLVEAARAYALLLVEPDGTALGVDLQTSSLARRPRGGPWTPIDLSGKQASAWFSSAWRLEDGRVFVAHGSRVLELPPGLAQASVAYDCNTRALGSCGASGSLRSFLRPLPDGRLVFLVQNPQLEVYAFRPGDAALTKLATLALTGGLINEQQYNGGAQGLAVDGAGNVYVALRTEQSGGEIHLLAHRPGAPVDAWVTAVTGLPRVVTLLQDDAGTLWLWDSSDSYSGLWKVIPRTATCKVCGE